MRERVGARRDRVKLGWAAEGDRVALVFGRLVQQEGTLVATY